MSRRPGAPTHRRTVALLMLACAGAWVRPCVARSQCPDGAPPPCNRARAAVPTNSVAVLYFENLGRDTSDAYIAEGLTEEVTARLGQVQRLTVTSRTAVRRLRNSADMPTPELGRALNAAYLVNGSVRRVGAQVRVTVELVRASSGARAWGEQFDRGTADLLAIQEDIARAVATGIAGQLLPAERASIAARPTRNAQAYDHYLRGLRAVNAFTPATIGVGIRETEAALRLDSSFAAARANLALAYALAVNWSFYVPDLAPAELLARASGLSERALRDSPNTPQVWVARGVLLMFVRPRTFEGAREALQHALTLEPDNASTLQWMGVLLRRLGDFDGARVAYQRSRVLDPTLSIATGDIGFMAYQRRQYAEALAMYDSALGLDTLAWQSFLYLSRVAFAMGDTARALREARKGVGASGNSPIMLSTLAQLEGLSGDLAAGRARIEPIAARLEAMDSVSVRDGYEAALGLIGTGQNDRAVRLLQRVRPVGPWLWSYLTFPDFDPVRHDPRFERIFAESAPPNVPRLPLP